MSPCIFVARDSKTDIDSVQTCCCYTNLLVPFLLIRACACAQQAYTQFEFLVRTDSELYSNSYAVIVIAVTTMLQ